MYLPSELYSIFLGVISGIATTLLVAVCVQIFRKILIPWFEELVYKGVDVTGVWTHRKENPVNQSSFEVKMDLEQRAHFISGTFQAKTVRGAEEYVNYYGIEGVVKDNYILFTYSAQKKDRTGAGAFLLRVSHGGTELSGAAVFTPDARVDDTEVVTREEMSFVR